jgi:hypothetical protein
MPEATEQWAYWWIPTSTARNMREDPPRWEAWEKRLAEEALADGWVLGDFIEIRDMDGQAAVLWNATRVPEGADG